MSVMRALTLLSNLTRARIMFGRNPSTDNALTLLHANQDLDRYDEERGYRRSFMVRE